jgi:hypothetical protein
MGPGHSALPPFAEAAYHEHMEALVPFAERIDPHIYEAVYLYERAGS